MTDEKEKEVSKAEGTSEPLPQTDWETTRTYLCPACRMLVKDVWVHSVDKLEQEHERGRWNKKYPEMLMRRKEWAEEHLEKIQKCRQLMDLVARKQRCIHTQDWAKVDKQKVWEAKLEARMNQPKLPKEIGTVEWYQEYVEAVGDMIWDLIPKIDDLVVKGQDGKNHLKGGNETDVMEVLVKVYDYMESLMMNLQGDLEFILEEKHGIAQELNRYGQYVWVECEQDEDEE